MDLNEVGAILERARRAAIDYYELTGKPLGITGEYGEYVAAERLGLELAEARTAGYDATDQSRRRIQIKARSFHGTRSSSANALVQLGSTTNGTSCFWSSWTTGLTCNGYTKRRDRRSKLR